MLWQERIHNAIARRAYELFEARDYHHGHDQEDWFRAEAEFLRPVPVHISEFEDHLTVLAQVLGFSAEELQISIEPYRVILAGKKALAPEVTPGKVIYVDWSPDQILNVVALPARVVPDKAVAAVHAGLLELDLPKRVPWQTSRS